MGAAFSLALFPVQIQVQEPSIPKPRDWATKGPLARSNFYRKYRAEADAYLLTHLTASNVRARIGSSTGLSVHFGETLLFTAVDTSNSEVVKILLNQGFGPDMCRHSFLLLMSAGRNDLRSVTTLLEFGADPNIVGRFTRTPLNQAVSSRRWKIASLLISYGALPTVDRFATARNTAVMEEMCEKAASATHVVLPLRRVPAPIIPAPATADDREEAFLERNFP